MSKTQADFVSALTSKITNSIRVAMPAFIDKYDFKTQKADIKIGVQEVFKDGSVIDYPLLSGVPVVFPKSGGASITMPVKKNDTCLLVFLDRDATSWLLGGNVTKPKSSRSHHLSDAVAIMGLSPFSTLSPAKNNTDMLVTFSGSEIILKPDGKIDIITAKEVNIKTEAIVINCKTANVNADDAVNVACKSAVVNAQEDIAIEGQNMSITSRETLNVNCNTLTATVATSATIGCADANINASNTINTTSPNFIQTGNMKITGNVEITGTTKIIQKLTTENGITNSGSNLISNGKIFETHKHYYQDVTEVIPPEGVAVVFKVPTETDQPT